MSLSGTTFNHSNSITAGTVGDQSAATLTWGGTFKVPKVVYDAQGHITTGTTDITFTMPSNPNTDTKVNVTLDQTHKAYLLATTTTPTGTTAAVEAVADTGVFLDTTAGTLTATKLVGENEKSNGKKAVYEDDVLILHCTQNPSLLPST